MLSVQDQSLGINVEHSLLAQSSLFGNNEQSASFQLAFQLATAQPASDVTEPDVYMPLDVAEVLKAFEVSLPMTRAKQREECLLDMNLMNGMEQSKRDSSKGGGLSTDQVKPRLNILDHGDGSVPCWVFFFPASFSLFVLLSLFLILIACQHL